MRPCDRSCVGYSGPVPPDDHLSNVSLSDPTRCTVVSVSTTTVLAQGRGFCDVCGQNEDTTSKATAEYDTL